MTSQQKALIAFDAVCRKHNLQYAVIGGFALMLYGGQRATRDVDVTMLVEFQDIRRTGEILLQYFQPRKEDPLSFFEQYFVLPVTHIDSQTHIDISAGVSGFDNDVILRSKRKNVEWVEVNVASMEDLIIYKIIADRARDKEDVEYLF